MAGEEELKPSPPIERGGPQPFPPVSPSNPIIFSTQYPTTSALPPSHSSTVGGETIFHQSQVPDGGGPPALAHTNSNISYTTNPKLHAPPPHISSSNNIASSHNTKHTCLAPPPVIHEQPSSSRPPHAPPSQSNHNSPKKSNRKPSSTTVAHDTLDGGIIQTSQALASCSTTNTTTLPPKSRLPKTASTINVPSSKLSYAHATMGSAPPTILEGYDCSNMDSLRPVTTHDGKPSVIFKRFDK
ncbi:hypothetical protein LIER_13050 [Lithospermum erythrorhizon]|uniref:Uncharacterized protein n=1 Tax=Lithospermum erythrorhizon TaxID=34254 RepID=A0AAV3PUT8_LITER